MNIAEKLEQILKEYSFNENTPTCKEDVFALMEAAYNLAVDDALKTVAMSFHDGHIKQNTPTKWHQMGAHNITVDKNSILKLKI